MAETVFSHRTPETQSTSQFLETIKERIRRVREDVAEALISFLHSRIAMGLTLAHIAGCEAKSEKRIHYTWKARDAYERAVSLSRGLQCTAEEAEKLDSELRTLQDRLVDVGNGHGLDRRRRLRV